MKSVAVTRLREVDLLPNIVEMHNVLGDNIGMVTLVDVMPRLVAEGTTADDVIADVARTSYGEGTKRLHDNKALVRYLLRHKHTSPFEFVQFHFRMDVPIPVRTQMMRHRTGAYNEESARYSVVRDNRYIPPKERRVKQSTTNKQGSSADPISGQGHLLFDEALDLGAAIYDNYRVLTGEEKMSREVARFVLPQNMYTRYDFSMNLHNLLHFLKLRLDPHAQEETRKYAAAMYDLIKPIVPTTINAFDEYSMGSITLSEVEIRSIQAKSHIPLGVTNLREIQEYQEKLKTLGHIDKTIHPSVLSHLIQFPNVMCSYDLEEDVYVKALVQPFRCSTYSLDNGELKRHDPFSKEELLDWAGSRAFVDDKYVTIYKSSNTETIGDQPPLLSLFNHKPHMGPSWWWRSNDTNTTTTTQNPEDPTKT